MATVLVSLSRLVASFRALLAGFAAAPAPQWPAATAPALRAGPAREPRADHGMRPSAFGCRKPLRVVRVLEPSAPRSTAGRMVISGRLADVCAELERLAALEARGC